MKNEDIVKSVPRNNSDMLIARRGGLVIADTSAHTGRWGAIVCETDAVIAAMSVDGESATLNNYCTANRSAGNTYFMDESKVITSITLTSGRVHMVNE